MRYLVDLRQASHEASWLATSLLGVTGDFNTSVDESKSLQMNDGTRSAGKVELKVKFLASKAVQIVPQILLQALPGSTAHPRDSVHPWLL